MQYPTPWNLPGDTCDVIIDGVNVTCWSAANLYNHQHVVANLFNGHRSRAGRGATASSVLNEDLDEISKSLYRCILVGLFLFGPQHASLPTNTCGDHENAPMFSMQPASRLVSLSYVGSTAAACILGRRSSCTLRNTGDGRPG